MSNRGWRSVRPPDAKFLSQPANDVLKKLQRIGDDLLRRGGTDGRVPVHPGESLGLRRRGIGQVSKSTFAEGDLKLAG
jgi:hypothetical protein